MFIDGSCDRLLVEKNYSIVKTAIFDKFWGKDEHHKVILRAIDSELDPNSLIESKRKIDYLFTK